MSSILKTIIVRVSFYAIVVFTVLAGKNDNVADYAAQKQAAIRETLFGPADPNKVNPAPMRVSARLKKLEARLALCEPGSEAALALRKQIFQLKRNNFISVISNKLY